MMESKVTMEQALSEIPMVREYSDIFPEDISNSFQKGKSSFL